MYFIPQKNKWYSWAVHTRPLYRYFLTASMAAVLLIGWRYGLYAWLDSSILYEQAAIVQLQQKLTQIGYVQRGMDDLSQSLPVMRKKIQDQAPANIDEWHQKQFSFIIDEAQKAGVQITSYNDEKEKKKSCALCRYIQLDLIGKFEQISRFLTALKQSPHMISCKRISSSRTDGDMFTASCGLQFLAARAF